MAGRRRGYRFPVADTAVGALLKRRRLQMLLHSCLYYELNTTIVGDNVFDAWAKELARLLKEHPNAYSDRFDKYFESWDGSSGYHLPHRDPWVMGVAEYADRRHNDTDDK